MVQFPDCPYRSEGHTLITQKKVMGCDVHHIVCYPHSECIDPSLNANLQLKRKKNA